MDQDSWTMWALKGQAFFHDGTLRRVLEMYAQSDLHHPGYPPAQPLAHTWGYLAMGGISERLVKVIFPLWYAACLIIVWQACRQWLNRSIALCWTLLLATTPLLLDHATLNNADLPLAVALLLGAFALSRWIEIGERRCLVGAVLALAGAAWIKLDGMYLGLAFLGAALFVRSVALYRQHASIRLMLLEGLFAMIAILLIIVPWSLYTRTLGLLNDAPGTSILQRDGLAVVRQAVAVMLEELLFSYNNSAWGLLGGGYGILWIVWAGAIVCGWRRFRNDAVLWFLTLTVLGGFAFYVAIYTCVLLFRRALPVAPSADHGASASFDLTIGIPRTCKT